MQTRQTRLAIRLRNTLLSRAFQIVRKVKPVRERVTLGEKSDHVEREHVARYVFARQFCKGIHVADVACGTGYGSQILREVAASVESYDKELLCGNQIVDLEQASWEKSYDTIVSFETIEHLANPDFFLQNIQRTTKLMVISSPVGELPHYNPHHKQVWSFAEFREMIENRFDCTYYFQSGVEISDTARDPVRFVIAVGTPRHRT